MQMQAKKGCKKRQSEVENYGNVRIFPSLTVVVFIG